MEDITDNNSATVQNETEANADIDQWMRDNPGVIRDVGRPGCRNIVVAQKNWLVYDYDKTFWGSDEGICGAATIFHAVACMRGQIIAQCHLQEVKEIRPVI